MKRKRLFIIGNGFDLANGINTSYRSFYSYLKQNDYETFNLTCALFWDQYDETDSLWSDFEANLSAFNSTSFDIDVDIQTLDIEHVAVADAKIARVIDAWKKNLYVMFKSWIRDIFQGIVTVEPLANNTDIFLNFNYTATLELLYGIPSHNILHIHNSIENDTLILGHGVEFNRQKILEFYGLIENGKIKSSIEDYLYANTHYYIGSLLRKDVQSIIKNKMGFFDDYSEVEEIVILGHSLGAVDLPYFKWIADRYTDCQWKVGYYKENEIENFKNSLKMIGVNNCKFEETKKLIVNYFNKLWTKDELYLDDRTDHIERNLKKENENSDSEIQEILRNLSLEHETNNNEIIKLSEKPVHDEEYYLKTISSYRRQLIIGEIFRKYLAAALGGLGVYYQSAGNDEKALEQYTAALQEYIIYGLESLEDSLNEFTVVLHNIAIIYNKHDEITVKELQMFDTISSADLLPLIPQSINDYVGGCFLLGLAFFKRMDYKRAIIFLTIAKNAYEQIGNKPIRIALCNLNKAKCLINLKE